MVFANRLAISQNKSHCPNTLVFGVVVVVITYANDAESVCFPNTAYANMHMHNLKPSSRWRTRHENERFAWCGVVQPASSLAARQFTLSLVRSSSFGRTTNVQINICVFCVLHDAHTPVCTQFVYTWCDSEWSKMFNILFASSSGLIAAVGVTTDVSGAGTPTFWFYRGVIIENCLVCRLR